ncbi:hypothetical protein B5P46_29705 [Rhizobium leguminosarum]|uniref:Uncharacterized protein n=1 Tax=Rhizobium leguminosarum TaxID=384 RepID=A0A4Q1TFA1_RHILE|nr:hypothetical protein B5P46_29705 [Rhizobium leguminosarum]
MRLRCTRADMDVLAVIRPLPRDDMIEDTGIRFEPAHDLLEWRGHRGGFKPYRGSRGMVAASCPAFAVLGRTSETSRPNRKIAKRFPETRRWEGQFLSDLGLRKPEFDDAALMKTSNMLHGMLHGLAVSSGEHRQMQGIPMQHECDTEAGNYRSA